MKLLLRLLVIAIVLLTSSTLVLGINQSKCAKSRQKRDVTYKNHPYRPSSYKNGNSNYNTKNKPVVCKPSRACVDPNSIAATDVTWMTEARLYYVIASSCYTATNMANVFLGRPVRTEQELDQMCLTFFVNKTVEYQAGYGKQIVMNCDFLQNGGRSCTPSPVDSDSTIDVNAFVSAQCVPVVTDGSTFSIYIRCQNNKQDILLLSTTPYVEEIAFVKLLDVANTSGFPISEIKVPACYSSTYPNPFEDYLQNSGPYKPNSCISPYTASGLFL